jgi:hypothetical protein
VAAIGGAAIVLDLEGEGRQRRAVGIGRRREHQMARGDVGRRDEGAGGDGVAVVGQGPAGRQRRDLHRLQRIGRVDVWIAESEIGYGESIAVVFRRRYRLARAGRSLVDVADIDRESLRRGEDSVGRPHGDVVAVAGAGLVIDLVRVGDRHHAGGGIDLEAAAGRVRGQRIGDREVDDVMGFGRDTYRRIGRRVFGHDIVGGVGIDRRRHDEAGDRRKRCAGRAAEIERLEPVLVRKGQRRRGQNDVPVEIEKQFRSGDTSDCIGGNGLHGYSCDRPLAGQSLQPLGEVGCELVHICRWIVGQWPI